MLNMCQRISRKGEEKSFILYDISSTPMIRHVFRSRDRLKVKFQSSPDDPLLKEYWLKRQHIHVALAKSVEPVADIRKLRLLEATGTFKTKNC